MRVALRAAIAAEASRLTRRFQALRPRRTRWNLDELTAPGSRHPVFAPSADPRRTR